MKIIHINLFDAYGGAARIANDIIRASRAAGHEVHLFSHKVSANDPYVIPIPYLEQPHFQQLLHRQAQEGLNNYYSTAILRVLMHPAFHQADIVHLHCIYSGYFSYLLLPLLAVKPVVWTFHDTSIFTAHCLYPHRCDRWQTEYCSVCPMDQSVAKPPTPIEQKREFMQHLKERIFKLTDFTIVVPSQWMKTNVEQSIMRDFDTRLIYNGIDTTIYKMANKNTVRRKLKLPLNKRIIMFAAHGGLNSSMKGGQYLIAALKKLQSQFNDIFFINIGTVDNSILNDVTIPTITLPYIENANLLAEYYAASDIFVSTSLAESFGLTVCEAMACGTPVIAFAVGGIPEIIDDGVNGCLVSVADVEHLSMALTKFLHNKELCVKAGLLASKKVSQLFTTNNMCQHYNDLYNQLQVTAKGRKKNTICYD